MPKTTSKTVVKSDKYADKPLISAFISKFEVFLKTNNLPSMKGLNNIHDIHDEEFISDTYDMCYEYLSGYIKTELADKEVQHKIIKEFGFKNLIDLMCEYNGDEICELDLFVINEDSETMSDWLQMLLSRVAKLS